MGRANNQLVEDIVKGSLIVNQVRTKMYQDYEGTIALTSKNGSRPLQSSNAQIRNRDQSRALHARRNHFQERIRKLVLMIVMDLG